MKTFLAISIPSMILGGVLFGSVRGHADAGRDHYWPSSDANVIAQVDPRPAPRPIPAPAPAPRVAPVAPVAPVKPIAPDDGVSVEIHDGKITIAGIPEVVSTALRSAKDAINSTNLPKDAKDKLNKHLDNIRTKVTTRLAHINITDLDQLGDEMSRMGDDISAEMEELGHEMEKYNGQLGKDFAKNLSRSLGKKAFTVDVHGLHGTLSTDDDDDDKLSSPPDVDDDDELEDAVKDLGDLSLKPPQRDQIQKLRSDSDRAVATAKKQLDQASTTLKNQLDNPSSSDADIARSIDAVTQQEAAIRKARILAWHGARRVLDDAQRTKVQDAASKAKKTK